MSTYATSSNFPTISFIKEKFKQTEKLKEQVTPFTEISVTEESTVDILLYLLCVYFFWGGEPFGIIQFLKSFIDINSASIF